MKKKYIIPTILTVRIETAEMIASSVIERSTDGKTATVDVSSNDYDGEFHSNGGYSVWSDDE